MARNVNAREYFVNTKSRKHEQLHTKHLDEPMSLISNTVFFSLDQLGDVDKQLNLYHNITDTNLQSLHPFRRHHQDRLRCRIWISSWDR